MTADEMDTKIQLYRDVNVAARISGFDSGEVKKELPKLIDSVKKWTQG